MCKAPHMFSWTRTHAKQTWNLPKLEPICQACLAADHKSESAAWIELTLTQQRLNEPSSWRRDWQHRSSSSSLGHWRTGRQTDRQHGPLCPLTMGICPSSGWADLWMKPYTFRSEVVGTEEVRARGELAQRCSWAEKKRHRQGWKTTKLTSQLC